MTTIGAASARRLNRRDELAVREVLARDPIEGVLVSARLGQWGSGRRAGAIWGYGEGRLQSICYSGPNLIPVQATAEAIEAFARMALREGQICSSIVGLADVVLPLWAMLNGQWRTPREIRPNQLMMATRQRSAAPADPVVRRARISEIDTVYPSSVAMFCEEIGISPEASDGGVAYRQRLYDLIAVGRCFVRMDGERVIYRAELGACSDTVAQIQGVWVDPAYRGRGLGTAGTAAVVDAALSSGYDTVSLYVNDFNEPARRAYDAIGFQTVSTFASILF